MALFSCKDAVVGKSAGAGIWAPALSLYDHPEHLTVVAEVTGGSCQVAIGAAEARDLAKILTEWADSSEAAK